MIAISVANDIFHFGGGDLLSTQPNNQPNLTYSVIRNGYVCSTTLKKDKGV